MLLEKAYVRFREDLPDNPNAYAAADGFTQMGVKVVPFHGFGDIETFTDLGPDAIVCGNIGDVWAALKVMGVPRPKELDYPEHLKWLVGREIRQMTLEEVRRGTDRVFVKPVLQKLFTGLVWDPADPRSRLCVAPYPYETPVLVSEVVDFVSEWRCFVKRDQLVGVKHYKGDWSRAPDREKLMEAIWQGRGKMPVAHALDLGVTDDGRTLLVEANEGYALGHYGLASIVYARFLEARWEQFVMQMGTVQNPPDAG